MVSVSLESVSKQIEDISWRMENLGKSLQQLQPHSSALSFSLQWQEIEHYFYSIKKSIDDSFCDLESKAHKQQQTPQPQIDESIRDVEEIIGDIKMKAQQQQQNNSTLQSQIDESILDVEEIIGDIKKKVQQQQQNNSNLQSQIDESIRDLEEIIRHLELKLQQSQIDESPSDLESKSEKDEIFFDVDESKEPRIKLFTLGLLKSQPETETITDKKTQQGRGEPGVCELRSLIKMNKSSLSTISDTVTEKLRSSADPAKMAFDVIDGLSFYQGQRLVSDALMKIAPEMEITVAEVERKKALKLAGRWKNIMSGVNFFSGVLPLSFLKLVRAFELISDVGVDGLFVAFSKFDHKKERIPYFREFGLEDKAPDFIRKLISENRHIDALDFAFAFKLQDKFPPLPLLEDYLKEAKKAAQELCRSGDGNPHEAYTATKTQLRAMNSVIKTIKEYNIEAESLLESVAESRCMLKEQSRKERKAAKAVRKPQQQLGDKQPQPAAKARAGPQNMKKLERHPQPAPNISPPPQRTGLQIDHVSPESYSPGSYRFVEPSSGLAASYNNLGSSLPAGPQRTGQQIDHVSPESYSPGSYRFVEPSSGLAASYNNLGSSLPAGPQRTGQQIDHVSPQSYSPGSYRFVGPSSGLAASYNNLGSSLPAGPSVLGERPIQPSSQLRTFWVPNPYYPSHHP
ncbi:hypothetical protein MRB53_007049 [Persea americana]|uniref:Uncharacterized protein n=1 Tax=Persea americana TaxID=3435 RepID=A0ACC2MI59_PERAE|nr:hypothetical protein MRB53_007049 [Persea americana]